MTANFAGENYIKVGNSGVEVVGDLLVNDIKIVPTVFEVKSAELKFNTVAQTIEGSASVLIPAGIVLGGSLGLASGKLDSIGINVDRLNIPIASTGASLQSLGGSIKNINSSNPVQLIGKVGITDSVPVDKM